MLDAISNKNQTLAVYAESFYNDLPTKIKYKGICIHDFKFENQTNETTVGSDAKIYGRLILNLQPDGKFDRLRQVVIGIKGIGVKHLVFSERKVIGKRLEGFLGVDQYNKVYESYLDYPKDFQIRAPSCPGLYEVEVCLLELKAEAIVNPGALNGFFKLSEQDTSILSSENAADRLFKNDQSCKVSMGRIRVI